MTTKQHKSTFDSTGSFDNTGSLDDLSTLEKGDFNGVQKKAILKYDTSGLASGSFQEFLQKENNSYTKFILYKLLFKEERQKDKINRYEKHHIIPRHAAGQDVDWNLVPLLHSEHAEAHKLLFECYGNFFDLCAYKMLIGQTEEGKKAMWQANQNSMRERKVGFFDPKLQRILACRPQKQRKPYARSVYVISALQFGFILQSQKTGAKIEIYAKECLNIVSVINKWVSHPEMAYIRQQWLDSPKKQGFALCSGLTRILTGHMDKKTNQAVYSIHGWILLGIFLPQI